MTSESTNFSDFKTFLRSGYPPKMFGAGMRKNWNWSCCPVKIAAIIFCLTIV